MFYIMFLTGLRVGEIGGLKWSDVDFENKCINVNRSLSIQYEGQPYSTTIDIYTHVTDDKFVEETGKLGPAMGGEEEVEKGHEILDDSDLGMTVQGYGFMSLC